MPEICIRMRHDGLAERGLIKIVDGKVVILDEAGGVVPEKAPEATP
jgi:hypothetical protein